MSPTPAPPYVTHADGCSTSVSLVWNGTEFALAWEDSRETIDEEFVIEIYFTMLDSSGVEIGDDQRITMLYMRSFRPSRTL